MIVNSARWHNVAGIEQLEIQPKSVTVFEGFNGSGKSSALKGLRSCLTKGDFAQLLPEGADRGETVLVMSDGTTIRRELRDGISTLSIEHKGIGTLTGAKANSFVENMLDTMSVDAEAFLYAKPKDRTRLVLEAFPFSLDADGLKAIIGDVPIPSGHPLEVIDAIHKGIYEERTIVNREAKKSEAAASEIAAGLGEQLNIESIDQEITTETDRLTILENEKAEKIESAQIQCASAIDDATTFHKKKCDDKRREIQAQIDALNEQLNVFLRSADSELSTTKESANASVDDLRSALDAEYGDTITNIKLGIQSLRNGRDQFIKDKALREVVDRHTKDVHFQRERSKQLSETLDRLNEFKNNMLTKLPLPGIELKDGEILIDGKSWDQVPDSRLAILAVDLAIARAGASDIVVMDGLEKLDDVQFANFEKYLQKSGRQVFVARAKAIPFQVRTLEAA